MARPRLLAGSLAAAFLVVPVVAYLALRLLPLSFDGKAGLWVVAITPGAPMIFSAASRRGLGDPELAASFQVAVALLVVLFAPLWLEVISVLTGSDYRMDPLVIVKQVLTVQLIPILLGLMIHRWWPNPAERAGNAIARFGFLVLMGLVVLILIAVAPSIIRSIRIWNLAATALVAVSAVLSGHYLAGPDLVYRVTIANANAQRNPGLALAIAAWNLPHQKAATLLTIVVYVLVAAVVAAIYTKISIWLGYPEDRADRHNPAC